MLDQIAEELDVVMLCRFGSHLYGTDTPNSDTDYKGIFMPTREQIFLGNIPKSMRYDSNSSSHKNSPDDVDAEMYSLHYFLELACKGETAALDMLHCNEANLFISYKLWDDIHARRSMFYTRSLKAFVGYARKQAAKYGLKGTRLAAAEELLGVLREANPDQRLVEIWEHLPVGEHAMFLPEELGKVKLYQWCGKQVQATAGIGYTIDMVRQFIQTFGERAVKAKMNDGVDWKAMSHALRAAYQVEEILLTNDLVFPLKEARFLRAVKAGGMDFTTEVLPALEDAMDRVEALSSVSKLPNKADRGYWDQFIVDAVEDYVLL